MMQVSVPKGWASTKLRDVAELERVSIQPANISTGTTYVGLEHIVSDGTFLNIGSVEEGELASSKFSFGPDHLLYGKLRPYLKKIIRPDFHGVCSTDILPLKPSTKINKDYLFHYLRQPSMVELATSRCSGANLPRLSPQALLDFPVTFPSLPEQKRIAAILDKADSIRRKQQEAVRLTEELLRSVYAEKMKISRAPEVSISEMLEQKILLLHKDGNHGSQYPRTEEFGETGIPFLSASCFDDSGGLIESQVQFLSGKKASTLKIGWIKSGDVLLAHNATVGRVALYDGRYEEALIGTSLTAFRTDNTRLKPEFLYCALRSWSFQNQLEKNMGQTTRNQVPITAQRDLMISLPGIDLQEQIVNVQRKLNTICDSLSAGSDYSINLFDSILQRSFKGEI